MLIHIFHRLYLSRCLDAMRGQVVCEKDVKTVLTKLRNGLDQYHVLGLGNSNMNFNTTSAHESVTFFFFPCTEGYNPMVLNVLGILQLTFAGDNIEDIFHTCIKKFLYSCSGGITADKDLVLFCVEQT